ncbi:hypothetical protein ACLGIH_20380 [Streptomyces sp. HMX87]|uniref:hypothetical protein n=1 Tax=Streptomyces sp. HMX87 TaxID=3390849 RepID=UPI003A847BE5
MRRSQETRDRLAHLRTIRHEIPAHAFEYRWFQAARNRRFLRQDIDIEIRRMTAHRTG